VAVAPRGRRGGFPIKLLNYMEAGRAIVARQGLADSLVHGTSAWLLPGSAPVAELAFALRRLADDAALAARLGAGARDALARLHDPALLARRTLQLIEALPPRG
jgi:glycosyltransferase involved in cell wall biosynthesis